MTAPHVSKEIKEKESVESAQRETQRVTTRGHTRAPGEALKARQSPARSRRPHAASSARRERQCACAARNTPFAFGECATRLATGRGRGAVPLGVRRARRSRANRSGAVPQRVADLVEREASPRWVFCAGVRRGAARCVGGLARAVCVRGRLAFVCARRLCASRERRAADLLGARCVCTRLLEPCAARERAQPRAAAAHAGPTCRSLCARGTHGARGRCAT